MWPVGQAVKTPASHAGNAGSIPARVTTRQGPGAATRPRFPYQHPHHAHPKRHLAPRYLAARLDISPARGTEPVFITVRSHPFPSRTRKLSSPVPKILGGKLPGKIGLCQQKIPLSFVLRGIFVFAWMVCIICRSFDPVPAQGATVVGFQPKLQTAGFNPRPRAGGDPCTSGRPATSWGFNPRPRAGGDLWLFWQG